MACSTRRTSSRVNTVGNRVDRQVAGSAVFIRAAGYGRADPNQQRRGLCQQADGAGVRAHLGPGNDGGDPVADAVPAD